MASPKKQPRSTSGGRTGSEEYKRGIREKIRAAIRQIWSRYAFEKQEVLYNAKKTKIRTNKDGSKSVRPNVVYTCSDCLGEFKLTEINVDHITPVGKTPEFPPDGQLTWDDWIDRLFCGIGNLRVLCVPCHKTKSAGERTKAAKKRRKSNV